MIERHGVDVAERGSNKGTLAQVIPLVGDQALRPTALNTLATAYKVVGEELWKVVGKVPEALRSHIEERFKRMAKECAIPGAKQPPKALLSAKDMSASLVAAPGAFQTAREKAAFTRHWEFGGKPACAFDRVHLAVSFRGFLSYSLIGLSRFLSLSFSHWHLPPSHCLSWPLYR